MKQLTVYLPDGETPADVVNWPQIDAGAPSTPQKFIVRNTGTESLASVVLSIVPDPTVATAMARIGLDPTGTAAPEAVPLGIGALALGTMAPLAERHLVVNWVVPANAPSLAGVLRFRIRARENP